MNRLQIARTFLALGTILVCTSSLRLVGFQESGVVHAREWVPSPLFDRTKKLKSVVPSQGCDARYVAVSNNTNYIVASDCNVREDNLGKTCIRCNGKYMMETEDQPIPGGDGIGSSFTLTCGYVEEGRCTGRSMSCEDFKLTTTKCGDVTEYGRQAITDPPVDP